MNQCCLHKSQVVHERGKRDQTQMACYIYFSGKGQMVATVKQVRCLVVEQVRLFGGRASSVARWSNEFGDLFQNPILLALARMSSTFCFLFASCFLLFIFWLRLLPCADAQSSYAYFQQSWRTFPHSFLSSFPTLHLVECSGAVTARTQLGSAIAIGNVLVLGHAHRLVL